MNRRQALLLSATLPIAPGVAAAFPVQDEKGAEKEQEAEKKHDADRGTALKKPGPHREAVLNYHAAQAALYSALTYADALEVLARIAQSEDMDLARSYVHTISREVQATNDSSVKVGLAEHDLEKIEWMKTLRLELSKALKGVDQAQNAVDGIGTLVPPSKEIVAHLLGAFDALYRLGESITDYPLLPPGLSAYRAINKQA